jgi:hypothetical protein
MIEKVKLTIRMKVKVREVKFDVKDCSQFSRVDEGQLLETK